MEKDVRELTLWDWDPLRHYQRMIQDKDEIGLMSVDPKDIVEDEICRRRYPRIWFGFEIQPRKI